MPRAVAVAPDTLQELAAIEHGTAGGGQRREEIELGGCEVDLAARADDRTGQATLDEFLSDNKIQATLDAATAADFTGSVTSLFVNGFDDYAEVELAGGSFYGAVYPVEVHTA